MSLFQGEVAAMIGEFPRTFLKGFRVSTLGSEVIHSKSKNVRGSNFRFQDF